MEMQSKKGKEPRRRQQGKRGCTGNCTGVMRHHSRRPNDAHAVLLHRRINRLLQDCHWVPCDTSPHSNSFATPVVIDENIDKIDDWASENDCDDYDEKIRHPFSVLSLP